MFAVLSTTPTYHDWILSCDMTSAFVHRKRVLQILQSTNPGRWVLKMPSDALFIRTLFATFPDAKVIWTHRDPYATFGSSTSMRAHSRPLFNKDAQVEYMRERFPAPARSSSRASARAEPRAARPTSTTSTTTTWSRIRLRR